MVKAVGRRLVVFAIFAGYPDIGDGARCERCGLHVGCHGLLLWVDDRCSIAICGMGGVSGLVQEVSDFAVLHGRKNARNPKTGEAVLTADRCKVRFKPGRELKEALHKIDTQELTES